MNAHDPAAPSVRAIRGLACVALACVVAPHAVGCTSNAVSEAQAVEVIDRQVASYLASQPRSSPIRPEQPDATASDTVRGSAPEPAAQLDYPGLSPNAVERAISSARFVASLDDLMKGYVALVVEDEHDSVLACATTFAATTDPYLQTLSRHFEKEERRLKREGRQKKHVFRDLVEKVNYTIDYEWKERIGLDRVEVFGCQREIRGPEIRRPEEEVTNCTGDGWCTTVVYSAVATWEWQWTEDSRPDCLTNEGRWVWERTDYIPNRAKGRYSNGPEFTPPELMRRMEARGITVPERVHCVVGDAQTKSKGEGRSDTRVTCDTGEEGPQLRLEFPASGLEIGRGDLVSAPLRDVQVGEGVLTVSMRPRKDRANWVLRAVEGTVRHDEARQGCPTDVEIARQLCPLTDTKSDPERVLELCAGPEGAVTLLGHAKTWHSRTIDNKAMVMPQALSELAKTASDDVWVWMTRASYQAAQEEKVEAATSLTKAHELSTDARQQLRIAKLARRYGDAALSDSATAKACRLGRKSACPRE